MRYRIAHGRFRIDVSNGFDSVLIRPVAAVCCRRCICGENCCSAGRVDFGQITIRRHRSAAGHPGLYDVLNGVGDGVETRFYCDPADGLLACVEMFPDEQSDPCEVYFGDYREVDGRMLPHRMEVRYGDHVFGVFTLIEFRIEQS